MVKKSFTITQLRVSVFFFFYNITSTLRINPHQGRMLYFQEEVCGPILRDVRCSHFSVKMYTKTKELGPIGGMCWKILLYPPVHDTN